MSTTNQNGLGGFEERLLLHLKAQVANQPRPAHQPDRSLATVSRDGSRHRRARSLLTAAAAALAAILVIFSALPGSGLSLAQAFPVLNRHPQRLSGVLKRLLRSQQLVASNAAFDDERAYAFSTPAGSGYVVVDERSGELCVVLPGVGADRGSVHCETATRLLAEDATGIVLVAQRRGREELIVGILRVGTATAVVGGQDADAQISRRNGILSVRTHGPVTIATALNGHRSSTTYGAHTRVTQHAARPATAPRRRGRCATDPSATRPRSVRGRQERSLITLPRGAPQAGMCSSY